MNQKSKIISMFIVLISLFQAVNFSIPAFSATNINTVNQEPLFDIAYNGTNRYVAVGRNGTIKISSNGTNWQSISSPVKNTLLRVIWNGKIFLAAGYGTSLVSSNGITWTVGGNTSNYIIRSVAWNGSTFVAVGDSNTILVSSNGLNWEKITSPVDINSIMWRDIVWNGADFTVAGQYAKIITSSDGRKWKYITPGCEKDLYAITWTGTQYICIGNTVLISEDNDSTWLELPGCNITVLHLATNGSIVVGSGEFGSIHTSQDGRKWNSHSINNNACSIGRMIWDGRRFIGTEGGGNIIVSANGSDWSIISTSVSSSPTATLLPSAKPTPTPSAKSSIKPTSTSAPTPTTTSNPWKTFVLNLLKYIRENLPAE